MMLDDKERRVIAKVALLTLKDDDSWFTECTEIGGSEGTFLVILPEFDDWVFINDKGGVRIALPDDEYNYSVTSSYPTIDHTETIDRRLLIHASRVAKFVAKVFSQFADKENRQQGRKAND